jgi:hypothetical protein
MAGSFGFEKDKYEVSVKCGEHALLPQVRDADPETLIIANGFSCQEQIAQLTNRHALHLAQVMQMVKNQNGFSSEESRYPEKSFLEQRETAVRKSMMKAGAGVGAVLAAGAAVVWALAGRRAA